MPDVEGLLRQLRTAHERSDLDALLRAAGAYHLLAKIAKERLVSLLMESSVSPTERRLTPDEIAVVLGISRKALDRRRHLLPFIIQGGKRGYSGSSEGLRRWLAQNLPLPDLD